MRFFTTEDNPKYCHWTLRCEPTWRYAGIVPCGTVARIRYTGFLFDPRVLYAR